MSKSLSSLVACAFAFALFCVAAPSFAQTARPYDLAQLSPEVRAAVEQAREAQRLALMAAARAEGNVAGHTRFTGTGGDNYAGQCAPCTEGDAQRHGVGVLSWTDGELYAGQHVADGEIGGRKHGYGVYIITAGGVYEGEFNADRRNGYGVMWDGQGRIAYQGRWANDNRAQ